jgi:hypothetical protein
MPLVFLALCGAFSSLPALAENLSKELIERVVKFDKEEKERKAKLAALPAECMLGDARAVPGQWIGARFTSYNPRSPAVYKFTLDEPIQSGAFHVALDAQGLRNFDKVESRDATGVWSEAWTRAQTDAPDGCELVTLAQTFTSGEREVIALRITIRNEQGLTWIRQLGVLKAD